jgi:hypothetical protein
VTLGILLPTRGRPHNLRRFLEATAETAQGDYTVYVRLDDDDPTLSEYMDVLEDHLDRTLVEIGPRTGFAASLNESAAAADRDGCFYIGMFGDDVEPKSPGWDVALTEALGGPLGVAYGDDGLRDKHAADLPTHYITQTSVYRRLGYLAPPGIKHLFLDNVARDIGRQLGRFLFVPVLIQHRHPWAEGEHLADKTYEEGGRNPKIRKSDLMAYQRWSRTREWRQALRS